MNNLFYVDTISNKIIHFLNHKYPYRIIYRGLFPRFIRKSIENNLDYNKQELIYNSWGKLYNLYHSNNLEKFEVIPQKKELIGKKIIWQYWGQTTEFKDLPEVVQISFNSVDKYKEDYKVIRLNDENLSEYIDLPNFIYEKRKNSNFRYVFFSDLLRLALLKNYGGIWIDATVLITSPIPDELKKQDYFMFYRDMNSPYRNKWGKHNSYFSYYPQHKINCLSSFIISKPEIETVKIFLDLLLYFWKTQDKIPHYFFFQILFEYIISNHTPTKSMIRIDDSLPHLLQNKIYDKFEQSDYLDITALSSIHKLTYIKKYKENSYFSYLKKEFLNNNELPKP
ncbi:capsular polysaccharide synthesis protein [Ursidibacter sp. B-7004-1]